MEQCVSGYETALEQINCIWHLGANKQHTGLIWAIYSRGLCIGLGTFLYPCSGGPSQKLQQSKSCLERHTETSFQFVGNISSCSGQKKRCERSSHTGSHIPCGVLPGLAVDRVSTPEGRSRRSKLYKRPLRRPSPLM